MGFDRVRGPKRRGPSYDGFVLEPFAPILPSGGALFDGGVAVVMVGGADFPRQPDRAPLLHIFRTGFQTVGNPLTHSVLAFEPSNRVLAEEDLARRTPSAYQSYTQPAAAGGMPLALMVPVSRRVDAETFEVRSNTTGQLNLLASQNTVGQPLIVSYRPSGRVESEAYEVRSAPPYIHLYRVGYQTVGQPLELFYRPSTRVEAETFEVRSALPYLHRFRTGYQTVGQPLVLFGSPRATRIEVEPDSVARRLQVYPAAVVSSSATYQPLNMLRQVRRSDAFFEVQTLHISAAQSVPVSGFVTASASYQPLVLMQRHQMKWALIEPDRFVSLVSKTDRVIAPSVDAAVANYNFEFGYWTQDVPDLNEEIWQPYVRYYTNYGAQMMPFRQYRQISLTTQQYDLAVKGSSTYCVDVDNFDNDPATPPATWTPDSTSGSWTPNTGSGASWTPPSGPSGGWSKNTTTGSWTTKQKQC